LCAELGPKVALVGCSAQGIAGGEEVTEDALVLGVMGFGGDGLGTAVGVARDIAVDPRDKGRRLARELVCDLARKPTLVVTFYDPLSGADVEELVGGMHAELRCPIVGGGAGQPWGPPVQTYQYHGGEVLSGGAVALALAGPFTVEIGLCHGTSPTGIVSTVTRSAGNRLFELDGRSALDCFRQATGIHRGELVQQEHLAAWALAVERPNAKQAGRAIRGAFGFDVDQGAVILQGGILEGSRVQVCRRTIEDVLEGTVTMGNDLAERLAGRRPWAVLGFECAAQGFPFLGEANVQKQHRQLRATVAPEAPWLGMLAWGEIAPVGEEPALHNYTYPLIVLTEVAS
jgi:hypothetical protein